MSHAYPHLAARLFNTPLLVHAGKLSAIVAGLSARFGVDPAPSAYATPATTVEKGSYRRLSNGVGVIDVFGVLAHRTRLNADSSYIQGYESLAATLNDALADSAVRAIVLNIDSPGGEVAGAFQLAEQIYRARGQKPIAAVASDMACSAAYLIASAANSLSVTPTGVVGSIGVVTCHADLSRALEKDGIAITCLYAGAHKIDGNPYQPLPPAVAAQLQADVDHYYELFLNTVASYRLKTPADALRATEAKTYIGPHAVAENLADFIETPDQVIARLASRSSPSSSRRALTAQKGKTMSNENDAPLPADVPIPEPTPAPPAMDPVALSQQCIAAGEPDLIPLLLQTPHTPEQAQARISQAGEIRTICALAHLPELAKGLISTGASPDQAKVITWNALVARDEAAPVDTTPPLNAVRAVNRTQFEAMTPIQRRDHLVASGRITD